MNRNIQSTPKTSDPFSYPYPYEHRSAYDPNRTVFTNSGYSFQPQVNKNIPSTSRPNDPFKYNDSTSANPIKHREDSYKSTNNLYKLDSHKPANKPNEDLYKSGNTCKYNDFSGPITSKSCGGNLNIQHTDKMTSKTHDNNKNCSNLEKKKDVSYSKLHNLTDVHKIDIQLEIAKFAEPTIKKNDTESNKSENLAVPPLEILTKEGFMTIWFSWKKEFLAYMELIDQTKSHKEKWCMMLLNRIGPIGQEIYRTFTFDDDNGRNDMDILLKKFDDYCIFENRKLEDNEDIDKYVNSLKVCFNNLYIYIFLF